MLERSLTLLPASSIVKAVKKGIVSLELVQNSQTLLTTLKQLQRLLLDGCPFDCAKKTLEKVGISNFECIRVTAFCLIKSKTDITGQTIETIAAQGRDLLKEVCFES